MTIANSTIKKIAKCILRGNYIKSMVVTMLLLIVGILCYNVASVLSYVLGDLGSTLCFAVLLVFLVSPIYIGIVRYFWRLSCNVTDQPIAIFNYFSNGRLYFRTIYFVFLFSIRAVICYFIFSIPVYVGKLITGSWFYSVLEAPIPIWTVNLNGVINVLHVIAIVATLLTTLKYSLAPMIYVSDESLEVSEVLHLSTVISKQSLLDFVFFLFSLFGWFALSFFVIPLVFTLPFILISYLVYCSYAIKAFNEKISRIKLDDIPTYIAGV